MEKFNEFEQWFLTESVNTAVEEAEKEVLTQKKKGVNLIYAPGYFIMVGKELLEKVGRMTKKQKK